MALTESEARILAALAALEPPRTMTVKQLCGTTGFTPGRTRSLVRGLSAAGLALGSMTSPPRWRPTGRGRAAIQAPRYRDHVRANGASS
jgi:DNA-binding IclR family transcriptional regulator